MASLTPDDIYLEPFDREEAPSGPPEPDLFLMHQDEDVIEQWLNGRMFLAYGDISYELLRSSWRLVQLAQRHEGQYQEGMALTRSSIAASTGAIAIACAAFESCLNYELFDQHRTALDEGRQAAAKILELAMRLTPRDRLEAFAAANGRTIDWGAEPFQSLGLLLSVRKHLLHDEPQQYLPRDGHWPSKQLRDLPRRIGSPYPIPPSAKESPLAWHVHILTPAGSEWAVRTVLSIVGWIESINENRSYVVKR